MSVSFRTFYYLTMKSQLEKVIKSGGKLTLIEALTLFLSVAVSTFLICKALEKK